MHISNKIIIFAYEIKQISNLIEVGATLKILLNDMFARRPTNQEIHDIIKSSCEFINDTRNKRLAFIKNSKIIQSTFPDDEYEIRIRTKEGEYRIGYIWKIDSKCSHEFKFQDCVYSFKYN